jgi:hypothetical protein
MASRKKYTTEKVLYFASREEGLHVDIDESSRTDLSELVYKLLNQKMLERVAEDDSGAYYKTTVKGEIRLTELQIEWRSSNGKPVGNHKNYLEQLKTEAV